MTLKAELHVHLEGTLSPNFLKSLSDRHGVPVPDGILNQNETAYTWAEGKDAGETLMNFVKTYDRATAVIKTPEDYFDITYDYLSRNAALDCIYTELTVYADPEPVVSISYKAMIDAISDAIDKARSDFDVEARILASFVRHFGPDQALKDAHTVIKHPHKYVTGIAMAGAETAYEVKDFVPAYNVVTDALGLDVTAHAGEATGPETIRACHELLGITRFGHMVRVVEDPSLMAELGEKGAVAEVCPRSNLSLGVFDAANDIPIKAMSDAGVKITINSDDPPFFDTDIAKEYDIAKNIMGLTEKGTMTFTENALQAAFVDGGTRTSLLSRLTPWS